MLLQQHFGDMQRRTWESHQVQPRRMITVSVVLVGPRSADDVGVHIIRAHPLGGPSCKHTCSCQLSWTPWRWSVRAVMQSPI